MPKLFLVSLGCPKNLADAEAMAGELAAAGWELTPDERQADAALLNTCAFLSSAVKESEAELRRLLRRKKAGKLSKVLVGGCLVEREREKLLKRFPGIDALVGVNALAKAAEAVKLGRTYILPPGPLEAPRRKLRLTAAHSAYLKVADGCDNRCAYCLIPSIRGGFRSKTMEAVEAEARALAQAGAVEISLIAQDTTTYGADLYGRPRLAELLRRLVKIRAVRWWRLMYVYPERVTAELISVMKANPRIVRYLDMPLQHIADPVLRRMNRRSTGASIKAKIAELRSALPDLALRTNFIAGFPGETAADFKKLLAFVREGHFDSAGFFAYSREPGTSAASLPGQVPEDVKAARVEALVRAQSRAVDALNRRLAGSVAEVLMDSPSFGRTYRDAPEIDGKVEVAAPAGVRLEPGTFVNAKIVSAEGYRRKAVLA